MINLQQKRLISLLVFFGVIFLASVGLIVYDVWAGVHWGNEATITVAMRHVHPMWIFLFGWLSGVMTMGLAFHIWFNPAVHGTEDEQ